MATLTVQRIAVAVVWLLAVLNTLACRGIYWDGALFLVYMLDWGGFHAGHVARSHVLWATQWPVVLAMRLGVTDTSLLAMAYSAGLFAVPAALYHLALHRARHDALLLSGVLAILVSIYLPTSFFIVGEYNATYAAATAAALVILTARPFRAGGAALVAALAFFCLRSYEAMVYIGPFLAAMMLWRLWRSPEATPAARLLGLAAAGFFLGAAVVAVVPMVRLWHHDYVVRVRAAAFDFWQNLQFILALGIFAAFALVVLLHPSSLRGRLPWIVLAIGTALLAVSPWLSLVHGDTILFAGAHYVSRTAAGALLVIVLAGTWLIAAEPRGRRLGIRALQIIREPVPARRLALALLAMLLASCVPDIVLTRMWSQYLANFRALVAGRSGVVDAREAHLYDLPHRNFTQGWGLPAFSLLLRSKPEDAMVLPSPDLGEPPIYEPRCGAPALAGYAWRR